MKTSTQINNKEFITRVVQQVKDNKVIPGYICQSGQNSGNVESDPSAAITNLYQMVFSNNTKLSGPLMMGLENEDILSKIIADLVFQPVIFSIGKLRIMVHMIGISECENWHWAGPGYTASLAYGKDNLLYLQGFDRDRYYIEIYTAKGLLMNTVYGKNPNDVWKNLPVLRNYNRMQLYALEEGLVNELLQHAQN